MLGSFARGISPQQHLGDWDLWSSGAKLSWMNGGSLQPSLDPLFFTCRWRHPEGSWRANSGGRSYLVLQTLVSGHVGQNTSQWTSLPWAFLKGDPVGIDFKKWVRKEADCENSSHTPV
eukprot:bmy_19222T0